MDPLLNSSSDAYTSPPASMLAMLEAIPTPAALIEGFSGAILATNPAWRSSHVANPLTPADLAIGADYRVWLRQAADASGAQCVLEQSQVLPLIQGLEELIAGRDDHFQSIYACHSNGDWHAYRFRGTRFTCESRCRVLILHDRLEDSSNAQAVAHVDQALRESEQRHRLLLEHAPDAVMVCDQEQIYYANRAYASLVGVNSPADVIGKSAWEFIAPPWHDRIRQRVRNALATGNPSPLSRMQMRRIDRTVVDVESSAAPCTFAGRPAVQAMIRDVSEQLRIERALRESERRFRSLADGFPGMIWVDNAAGDCIYYNRRWLQFRGKPFEQEQGLGWMEGVHPEDREILAKHHYAAMTRQEPFQAEYRLRRHDGVYRWIHTRCEPIRAGDGSFAGFIGSGIDITERKRDERRQKLLIDELDHRVKNTLATVLALAQQQFASGPDIESFREGFIGRLRAMSQTHDALARARWDGVDLRQLAMRVLTPYLQDRTARVQLDGPDVTLPSHAALPLGLALHELGTNAFKHGALADAHGKLNLHWEMADHRVRICWIESRSHPGPPVAGNDAEPAAVSAPSTGPQQNNDARRGSGLGLIEGLIGYELQGTVQLDFEDHGVRCILTVPLTTRDHHDTKSM